MNLKTLLSISAIYLALIGLGYLVMPDALLFGTLGAGAPAALIANLRSPASTFFGIAALNWMARNAEPSRALSAIVIGNVVGFSLASLLDVLAMFSGGPTVELIPAAINLLIVAAFIWLGRANIPATSS